MIYLVGNIRKQYRTPFYRKCLQIKKTACVTLLERLCEAKVNVIMKILAGGRHVLILVLGLPVAACGINIINIDNYVTSSTSRTRHAATRSLTNSCLGKMFRTNNYSLK